jgi:hypothetical protein
MSLHRRLSCYSYTLALAIEGKCAPKLKEANPVELALSTIRNEPSSEKCRSFDSLETDLPPSYFPDFSMMEKLDSRH